MAKKDYKSPISILHMDAIRAFLTSSNSVAALFHDSISKGLLNRVIIDSDRSKTPFRTPIANLETKEVQLHESHLSYLWTVCYFLTAVREITFEQTSPTGIIHLNASREYDTSILLLEWGCSLKTQYTAWPSDMVNPTHTTDKRISDANILYLYALQYLMYHEVGHLVLHYDAIEFIKARRNPFYEPTQHDASFLYNMEEAADNYAFDCMFLCEEADNIKFLKLSGAIVTHLSNFYNLSESDIRGGIHPDLDKRLRSITDRVEIQSEELDWCINHLYATGIQLFFCLKHVKVIPEDPHQHSYENWNEIGSDLYNILDQLKKDYNKFRPYREYLK